MTQRVDLSALDALAEAATPLPWNISPTMDDKIFAGPVMVVIVTGDQGAAQDMHNAHFIVGALNALPALKAEIEALRGALKSQRKWIQHWHMDRAHGLKPTAGSLDVALAEINAALGATS